MMSYSVACTLARLVVFPVIITRPGRYRLRNGEVATIVTMEGMWCHGTHETGEPDMWHRSGRLFSLMLSGLDIISPLDSTGSTR